MKTGKKMGRPLKFKTVRQLQKKIDEYFASCWSQKMDMFGNPVFRKDKSGKKTNDPVIIQHKPYTITGLAVYLDTFRDVLLDYQGKKDYSNAIKRAKERCQSYAEESLFIGKNPTGVIFNLKNNYSGWKDKTEVDSNHSGDVQIVGKLLTYEELKNESTKPKK